VNNRLHVLRHSQHGPWLEEAPRPNVEAAATFTKLAHSLPYSQPHQHHPLVKCIQLHISRFTTTINLPRINVNPFCRSNPHRWVPRRHVSPLPLPSTHRAGTQIETPVLGARLETRFSISGPRICQMWAGGFAAAGRHWQLSGSYRAAFSFSPPFSSFSLLYLPHDRCPKMPQVGRAEF
jgi:hypothetical protein